MESIHVLKKPLMTEKHTFHSGEANRYGFLVARGARKDEIKRAVEELYKVRVVGVSTQIRKGGVRRNKFGFFAAKPEKHAVVRIHPEDKIELF